VTPRDLAPRRRILFTMLTALSFRYPPGYEPPLITSLHQWLGGWPGIGRIEVGMTRQGFDLELTRYDAQGWRATFYPAGIGHSLTPMVGSAWPGRGRPGRRCSGRRGRGYGKPEVRRRVRRPPGTSVRRGQPMRAATALSRVLGTNGLETRASTFSLTRSALSAPVARTTMGILL
jgi:hypothetical protein